MLHRKINNIIAFLLMGVLGFAVIALGAILAPVNRFYLGLFQMLTAVGIYFASVLFLADRNWLDIRAVFSGVWLFTTGLAALRLTDYQEAWQSATWLCMAIAYLVFQIGATLGIHFGGRISSYFRKKFSGFHIGKLSFSLQKNRLFGVCIGATLIGLICFTINALIRGYIPVFSNSHTAYIDFYTRFHVFSIASTAASGLCYYTMVTQPLAKWKKGLMGLCCLYLTVIFPILILSRGAFITSALSLTVTMFYLHKKRFWVMVVCLISMFSIYLFMSNLRGYSDTELDNFFEPSDIVIEVIPNETIPDDSIVEEEPLTFSLPPKVAFVYTYLTVSHDNFNEAVQNVTSYTYGTRQLAPFNVILRTRWIADNNGSHPVYLVRSHLNTTNVIGDFYYDFGFAGVILCTLLWSFIFGLMQAFFCKNNGPFALLTLGNAMVPVALCFFSSWLSTFTHWVLWGVVLLMGIASCVRVLPKK